jgi:uncharacterized OsmC-like protein
MATASIIYQGDLRCECTHLQSGSVIQTDAPSDNHGKGERFSPTDTVCIALGTCVITTMGIRAADMKVKLEGTKIDVTKIMVTNPRRIGSIHIVLCIPGIGINVEDRKILELIGDNCPVKKSLHPDLEVIIQYNWLDF